MIIVKNSPRIQETAFNFASSLNLAHKIWSELMDYKNDKSNLYKKDSIFDAIFKDKYQLNKIPVDSQKTNETEMKIFNQNILEDCKNLFEKHYLESIENLNLLQNENSQSDAVESLKSILHVMKKTI